MGPVNAHNDSTGIARHGGRLAVEGYSHGSRPCGILDIVAIVRGIFILLDLLGRLLEGAVIQLDFLGGNLFLNLTATEDDVNDRVHVTDVDLAVAIDVTGRGADTSQDDVDHGIHIADVDLAVGIHIAGPGHHRQRRGYG